MKILPAKRNISGLTLVELLFLQLALSLAQADTNSFAILTTADGISYTNAHVYHTTPVELSISHQGGFARIALTNLAEPVRRQYPYDSNAAAQFPALEKQQAAERKAANLAAAAAQQVWLQEQTKNAGWVYIEKVVARQEPEPCTILTTNGEIQVYLKNAPRGLTDAEAQIMIESPSDFPDPRFVNSKSDDTELRKGIVKDMENRKHVRAFDTGLTYNRLPLWQCVTQFR